MFKIDESGAMKVMPEGLARAMYADKRYGIADSYADGHLAVVVGHLRAGGFDEDVVTAGWMHDAIEDGFATEALIEALFGARVARIVAAVTDKPGHNRAARHAATYPVMRALGGADAVAVKVADRLANMTASSPRPSMYTKEYPMFREWLYDRTDPPATLAMWAQLDELTS